MDDLDHKHYEEYVDLRGDGRIVMYKRKDHSKRPKWNVRLKVPNTKGYVVKSTRTDDFNEGKRFSEDLYYELEGKVRRGETLKSPSFSKVVDEFIGDSDFIFKERSEQYKKGNVLICKKHLVPYYDKTPIDQITEDMMSNFISEQIRKNTFSNITLRHFQTVMKKVMEFGRRRGYLNQIPPIPKPPLKINSRSDFSKDEWKRLYEYMRDWIKHPNNRVSRQRFYTQQYILILGNSGIRCGTELRSIRWSNISTTKDLLGDERVVISVKGKTDRRDVVCNAGIERYLQRLWEFRSKELGHSPNKSEHILVNPNGKAIQSYKGSFNSLLDKVKLSFDNEGKKRSPYSLRHTYITMRLMEGVNVYQLSSNVGTSVEMIENYYGHLLNRDPNVVSEVTKNTFTKDQKPSTIDFLNS
jgi:integrase